MQVVNIHISIESKSRRVDVRDTLHGAINQGHC
jgi:hypothetical protein